MPKSNTGGSTDTKPDSGFNGARKLIRPRLPAFLGGQPRREPVHTEDPLTHALSDTHPSQESSHAEAFYFQKQIQQATEMTVVLDDGDELHGTVEWYDRCVIKMRLNNRHRVMIYKSGIKYLFKSSEAQSAGGVMK